MYLRQLAGQFLCSFFRIVIRLQAHPEAARRAEERGQAQCRIRRDRPLAGADRRNARLGHANLLCQPVLGNAERNQEFLAQHFAGVNGAHSILRIHGPYPLSGSRGDRRRKRRRPRNGK